MVDKNKVVVCCLAIGHNVTRKEEKKAQNVE
jgi:hypothetical protein